MSAVKWFTYFILPIEQTHDGKFRLSWFRCTLLAMALTAIAVNYAHAADDPHLPNGATCETIRAYVALHGKTAALAWAVRNGYSWKDVSAARRCLR